MNDFSVTSPAMDQAMLAIQGQNANTNIQRNNQDSTKAVAEDFEAVFISQMLSHMFAGLEVDPVFGGGKGEEVFRSFMIEEYGKQIVQAGGIGVSEAVQAKLIEIQEATQNQ